MTVHRGTRILTWALIAVLLAALAPVLSTAQAKGGGVIAYGDTVTGAINNANYFEVWQFTGTQGDRVRIEMQGDGSLDAYLGLLQSSTEEVIAEDDDSAGNGNALIEMALPASGEYVIIATRYNLDEGTSQGNYTLTLSAGSVTPVVNPVVSTEPVELSAGVYYMGDMAFDTQVSGTISADSYAQIYTLDVQAGTEVVVGMFAAGGSLDPYLIFMTEDGDVLAEDDDSGAQVEGASKVDALLSLTVQDTATYYVAATRAGVDSGKSTGDYAVMAVISSQHEQPVDNTNGVAVMDPVTVGASVQGEITGDAYMHVYPYQGQAGEELTITMTGSGQLDAYLGVLDADGNVIAEDDDSAGGLNAQISLRLPESGTYLIVATRAGLDSGSTTGAYTLEVASGTPEPPAGQTGLGGFGGLPGRALTGEGETFYLRGLGKSDNPAKASALGQFLNQSSLPGRGSRKSDLSMLATGANAIPMDQISLP